MSAPEHDARRGLTAAALVVGGVALVGLLAGTRAGSYEPNLSDGVQLPGPAEDTDALPARSYTELMERPWGLGTSHRAAVQGALSQPQRALVPSSDLEMKAAALEARAEHRAFTGAPPSIPHPVGEGNGAGCRTCHVSGGMLGAALAPPMSHAGYAQCTQCHVPERANVPPSDTPFQVASVFEPLRGAADPERWSQAPPQTPHPTPMRERCDACHGPYGRHGLQSSHPQRRSCQQCHAPSALLDQMPGVP